MAQQTEKKMKILNKIRANPSVKLKDEASSKIDKIKSKSEKLNKKVTTKLTAKDEASSRVEKVKANTEKLNNKKAKVKIEAKDEASKVISKAQNKLKSFIKAGAKKVISIGLAGTVALGGIGVGTSVKTFANFEKGLSNVKAVTGATNSEMQTLKNTAKGLGASTAWSAVQVTEAEELLGQAGFSVKETTSALPGLLSLASAGDLELATATDIASGTLRAFNIKASETGHVSDVLALSASATNSDVTDLGESMKYCAPVSQALGISLEDTAAAAGLLSNANIKGSQAGTVLRATLARLASPTDSAAKLMKKYGINAFDTEGNMKPLSAVVDNLNSSLGKLTSQQRADVISTVFGTESMSGVLALMNQGGQSLGGLSKKLKDANGASKEMADTKLDNLSGQWTILKSAVEGAQIELGERLAPYAKQFVTWLTGKMPEITDSIVKFVDYISKNTTTIKSLATSVIGLSGAFVGLSTVSKIGNTFEGIKKVTGLFKGAKVAKETTEVAGSLKSVGLAAKILPALLSPAGIAIAATAAVAGTAYVANANLMKKSISTTTEELGPIEKIMNKLNGSINKSKSEMQGLGLIYEDFGTNIGSDFKKKVEESTKSLRDFQFFINKINLDGTIDEKESAEFNNRVNEMCNNAVKTIQSKKDETQSALRNLFADDGTVSEAEQSTLDYFNTSYDNQISAEQKLRDEIYDIKKKAIEDHGKLLDEDIAQVKAKQEEMVRIELEAVGGNQDENNYAKNKFKARAKGVDIKDASELLKESAKEHDDAIVEIRAKYDTYIDKLKSNLENPDLDAATRGNLESSLAGLEKAKADKIKSRNDLHDENLNTLYSLNPNLKGKLNKYTGDELKDGDIKAQKKLDKLKQNYDGLESITKTGHYRIYDSEQKSWKILQATVDEGTGEITSLYNTFTGECGGYTEELSSKVKELSKSHTDLNMEGTEAVKLLASAHTDAKGQILDSAGQIIANLSDVTVAEDGTRTGILNLNGTPIQINSNADGTITNMNDVTNAINDIPESKDTNTTTNAEETTSKTNELTDSINNVPESKTITITSIFKKVTQWVSDKVSDINDSFKKQNESMGTPWALNNIGQNASGTNYFKGGLSTVDERGWELSDNKSVPILGQHNGNPLTYMSKGTKILNHMQSVNDMKHEVSRQINSRLSNQPKTEKVEYQVVQPQQQVQVAGVGGLNFGDVNVNVDGNQDIDAIIAEATQEVARKLKEALTNIKK